MTYPRDRMVSWQRKILVKDRALNTKELMTPYKLRSLLTRHCAMHKQAQDNCKSRACRPCFWFVPTKRAKQAIVLLMLCAQAVHAVLLVAVVYELQLTLSLAL